MLNITDDDSKTFVANLKSYIRWGANVNNKKGGAKVKLSTSYLKLIFLTIIIKYKKYNDFIKWFKICMESFSTIKN